MDFVGMENKNLDIFRTNFKGIFLKYLFGMISIGVCSEKVWSDFQHIKAFCGFFLYAQRVRSYGIDLKVHVLVKKIDCIQLLFIQLLCKQTAVYVSLLCKQSLVYVIVIVYCHQG